MNLDTLGLTALADVAPLLEYQRTAILDGQWWRLWTGHWVHFSSAHALADGLACLLPALWLGRAGHGRRVILALLLAAPLIALVLLYGVPAMEAYRGASGLAVALWVTALGLAWQQRPHLRRALALCAGLLLAKLVGESLGWDGFLADLPRGVVVAWQAHWAGIALGMLGLCFPSPSGRGQGEGGGRNDRLSTSGLGYRPGGVA